MRGKRFSASHYRPLWPRLRLSAKRTTSGGWHLYAEWLFGGLFIEVFARPAKFTKEQASMVSFLVQSEGRSRKDAERLVYEAARVG